jgi:hypothetical protein
MHRWIARVARNGFGLLFERIAEEAGAHGIDRVGTIACLALRWEARPCGMVPVSPLRPRSRTALRRRAKELSVAPPILRRQEKHSCASQSRQLD